MRLYSILLLFFLLFFRPLVSFTAELTIVSSGGAYGDSQARAYHKPFMSETGHILKAEYYNGGLSEIRAQVEAGNVSWDVVDVEKSDAILACDEGLVEPIDLSLLPSSPDGVPASQDFLSESLQECAVATIIWSTIYSYDPSRLSTKPTTMKDFFDLEKFPGKRGLRKLGKYNLEFALLADGVEADDIYDVLSTSVGVDRAFAKLDTIKDSVIWWESGSQPPQMLADGEVLMTTAYNGRIFNAVVEEHKNFEIVWDGQVYDYEMWVVPKGGKNIDIAMEFIRFSTSTESLARQASFISYGPARRSSTALIGKYHSKDIDMGAHMPTHPNHLKNAVLSDHEFWADNSDQLEERFNAWLAK